MNNLLDILKEFKNNSFKRDVFLVISGFFLLLILNDLFDPNFESYPNIEMFSPIGKGSAVIVVSYFFSLLCREIGYCLEKLFKWLFIRNKKAKIKSFFEKLSKHINKESTTIGNRQDINNIEVENFIFNQGGVSSVYDRMIQYIVFERVFIGFTFILVFAYSPYVLVITFFLLFKTFLTEVEIGELQIDAAHFFFDTKKASSSLYF